MTMDLVPVKIIVPMKNINTIHPGLCRKLLKKSPDIRFWTERVYPQPGHGSPVRLLNGQSILNNPRMYITGYRRANRQDKTRRALTRWPEDVSRPLRSRVKTLPQPAATTGTFTDLFLGSVNNKWDPAKGQAEYHK